MAELPDHPERAVAGLTVAPDQPVLDAVERVQGSVAYVINDRPANTLEGRIVRSDVPHGIIRAVDCSAALRVPGVLAVITGADVVAETGTGGLYGELKRDTPIIAFDRVRYAGEPIAAVAAVDADAASEAAALVRATIEPLPAAITIAEAMAEDAPAISADGNLVSEMELKRGDPERAFDEADEIFEERFATPPVQGVPLEPHAVVARYSDDWIEVHSATQTPFHIRDELATIFNLERERVRVVVPTLGGGFGAKAYARIEPLAVVLARRTGRPVRIVLSRDEEFITVHRQASEARFRTGVSRDGRIMAMTSESLFGCGPFVDNTPRVVRHGLYSLCGPYRVAHLDLRSRAFRTNTSPCGPLRAPGTAQIQWAREAHLEGIAHRLGIEPIAFRALNLIDDSDRFTLGGPAGPIHLRELLEAVRVTDAGPSPTSSRRRVGVGYAAVLKTTQTPSTSEATVGLDRNGVILVSTSSVEMGQGARTVLAQMVAERLAVPLSRVKVTTPDTAVTPRDQGTLSSRTTFSMGTVVRQAAERIRERLLEIAEDVMEIDRHDLMLADGKVTAVGTPGIGYELQELLRHAGLPELRADASYTNEPIRDEVTGEVGFSTHYHQSTAAARVAVDPETGKVEVLEIRTATHAGQVVNRTLAELQLHGNATFGVGQALMEEVLYEAGQMQNRNLSDYLIPSMLDVPSVQSATLTEDDSHEIHGIGETALPAVVPAITNAISVAIGGRLNRLPATPERILEAGRGLAHATVP